MESDFPILINPAQELDWERERGHKDCLQEEGWCINTKAGIVRKVTRGICVNRSAIQVGL